MCNPTAKVALGQVNIFRALLPVVPMALFSHGFVNQWEKNTPVCLSKYAVNMFRGIGGVSVDVDYVADVQR